MNGAPAEGAVPDVGWKPPGGGGATPPLLLLVMTVSVTGSDW